MGKQCVERERVRASNRWLTLELLEHAVNGAGAAAAAHADVELVGVLVGHCAGWFSGLDLWGWEEKGGVAVSARTRMLELRPGGLLLRYQLSFYVSPRSRNRACLSKEIAAGRINNWKVPAYHRPSEQVSGTSMDPGDRPAPSQTGEEDNRQERQRQTERRCSLPRPRIRPFV